MKYQRGRRMWGAVCQTCDHDKRKREKKEKNKTNGKVAGK